VLDPIGSFQRIRELYLTYLETAFRIREKSVSKERRDLLLQPGTLCTEPLLEPMSLYETAGYKVDQLVTPPAGDDPLAGFTPTERVAFVELVKAGLLDTEEKDGVRKGKHPLYLHQVQMLGRGIRPGHPGVVTSGTGSGKTESFLLPILAMLAKEALRWEAPAEGYLHRRWWHDESGTPYAKFTEIPKDKRPSKQSPEATPFIPHRAGEHPSRPAAVRALVLYPMNALVEDQLVRLRKALDSDAARALMDARFNGNRLFLGRYTSSTPVTGFDVHPRKTGKDETNRRRQSLEKLFYRMVDLERTQAEVRQWKGVEDDSRFLFPSVDGAELNSRWDMQETPPDILITNVSMLNAMLSREVDAPIFTRTREWLEKDKNAYFFLVLDELHLQRGTEGTEVSYLLRLLLERLGLTRPELRHKLRILASSASLPMDGEERDKSLTYLWDMFGRHGTHPAPGSAGLTGKEDWASAIVTGKAVREVPCNSAGDFLATAPFMRLLDVHGATDDAPVAAVDPRAHPDVWQAIAHSLLGASVTGDFEAQVRACVQEAALWLARACWPAGSPNPRAQTRSHLASTLFQGTSDEHLRALRGLLLVRGMGDELDGYFGKQDVPARVPSFRLHTFFRSIEGLFAPAHPRAGVADAYGSDTRPVGALTIDRGLRFVRAPAEEGVDGKPLRLFEVLYCECCGELFFGGMRGEKDERGGIELLPSEPQLDGLPDAAASQRFEDLSSEEFAVFWPTRRERPEEPSDKEKGRWEPYVLDPVTGVVREQDVLESDSSTSHEVKGFLFLRGKGADKHERTASSPGTAVSYQCPACATDYSPRREMTQRLSPIRNFRTGFAKTTQLLATELFDVLRIGRAGHTGQPPPKLVSFSDSRQDAAKAAFDIERLHHQDIRREVLVTALAEATSHRPDTSELEKEKAGLEDDLKKTSSKAAQRALEAELDECRRKLAALSEPAVALADILETSPEPTPAGKVKPLIARFVQLGVHPVDPVGTRRIKTLDDQSKRWSEFFEFEDGAVQWKDASSEASAMAQGRRNMVREAHELMHEVIFSRSYFSLEESGLAFPVVKRSLVSSDAEYDELNAFLRILGDSYRFLHSPYDDPPAGWASVANIGKRSRILGHAQALWRDGANKELTRILEKMNAAGHNGALISLNTLHIHLVKEGHPFWRCPACERVHLHRGTRLCTRCDTPLRETPSGSVEQLRRENFLAKRVGRGEESFRLHCEELTGQTEDPAARQRRFRGIIIPPLVKKEDDAGNVVTDSEGNPEYEYDQSGMDERIQAIDLLTVTTTMEVGIDIGPLQAVLQSNMPPQRFNYQQRVGRAGRRGQAFSSVLTICRSKNHDLFYFAHPEKITGDAPPPPFLTRRMPSIALRFLRKVWLQAAFERMRDDLKEGEVWPHDNLRPPDIHGEYIGFDEYFDPALGWTQKLRTALEKTRDARDSAVALLTCDGPLSAVDLQLSVDTLLKEVSELDAGVRREGLAHTLAEAGLLPMYGMPTRVRNLYYGHRPSEEGGREWLAIDRDLDVAVHEFAPGSTLVKDKQLHRCVGFSGPLGNFRFTSGKQPYPVRSGEAFGGEFYLLECSECASWKRFDTAPEPTVTFKCEACGAYLEPSNGFPCREPLGFRTDFWPKDTQDAEAGGTRHRSILAEGRTLKLQPAQDGAGNLQLEAPSGVRTYRLNRGPKKKAKEVENEASPGRGFAGFLTVEGTQTLTSKKGSQALLSQQHIAVLEDVRNPFGFTATREVAHAFWLAAPKTTDALYLAPQAVPSGLQLHRISGSGTDTAVRAAALSATFILANRAALRLDIDPDEFDILEPRFFQPPTGGPIPVLQLTDHLVNGAGFCRLLGEENGQGGPLISQLLHSCVTDEDKYPLSDFLAPSHGRAGRQAGGAGHTLGCDQACYACLWRYGNQAYHGLLDWRLGLAFLSAFDSPTFRCGLDKKFGSPALRDWPELARLYAEQMVARFGGEAPRQFGELWGFRLGSKKKPSRWAVVTHPLWDVDAREGILAEAWDAFPEVPVPVNTFDLARRQVRVSLQLRGKKL
jgi:hypothetical protein